MMGCGASPNSAVVLSAFDLALLARTPAPDVYYPQFDTGTTIKDYSGNGHDLTATSAATSAASLLALDSEAAITWDYTTGSDQATSAYDLTQATTTAEYWVNPVSLTASGAQIYNVVLGCSAAGGARGWTANYRTNGVWAVSLSGVASYDFTGLTPVAAVGVTTYAAYRFRGTSCDLYLNGVKKGTITIGVMLTGSGPVVGISGFTSGVAGYHIRAALQKAAITKGTVTSTQIALTYKRGSGLSVDSPLGNNSSNAGGGSLALTTTDSADVGALVIVGVGGDWSGATTPTLADSAGNTWTMDKLHAHSTAAPACAIFSCILTNAIAVGATITATWSGVHPTHQGISAVTVCNPAASPFDATPSKDAESASAGTAASTGTTASPSTTDWYGFTICQNAAATPKTATPQAGWTEDYDGGATCGTEQQSIIGTTTTVMRGAATLSASADWTICTAVYKLNPTP